MASWAWSRDSAYVYFDRAVSGDNGYFRLRISDSKLEQLFDLERIHRFPTFAGSWTGLGPGDTPLLVRDMIRKNEYFISRRFNPTGSLVGQRLR